VQYFSLTTKFHTSDWLSIGFFGEDDAWVRSLPDVMISTLGGGHLCSAEGSAAMRRQNQVTSRDDYFSLQPHATEPIAAKSITSIARVQASGLPGGRERRLSLY
jgi:hypothetical protein